MFLTILDDNSEDTEVRISSYLGLIKRPNLEILHRIKFVLENVVNNQGMKVMLLMKLYHGDLYIPVTIHQNV